ncbi:hypothetical protein [Chromobacterium sp. IIBBL 290-4]|uniref:hypothetical protein n=1 Tax=Chromobacterium sp. IIBBL 290-4 TaxID=2953890 RepID=UPI0020B7C501|nr:hypothetical protein [Chromobacterium sp. IIBBL 290-4]UTH74649.1 hypothetical protein NKT35_00595 [Chromobacterium sp. IIBBL 290-4]
MANYFKCNERVAFLVLLFITTAVAVLALYCIAFKWSNAGKLLATAGLSATLTGVVQLEVAGLFTKILDEYGDDERYPYGPPSYITREIIDNPDTPVRTWLRDKAFFKPATGFWLIVVGTLIQAGAVWF